MPILTIIVVLVIVGLILWGVNTYIPMQQTMKRILNAVVILIVIIWLLQAFGVWAYLQGAHV